MFRTNLHRTILLIDDMFRTIQNNTFRTNFKTNSIKDEGLITSERNVSKMIALADLKTLSVLSPLLHVWSQAAYITAPLTGDVFQILLINSINFHM
uniref:Uncharacterized protein n=1 Tax=Physcomitrium patens TaxID=3218 RepID=A0A7I4EYK4_PHYPA